jgi:putative FmdB family regulatory protein
MPIYEFECPDCGSFTLWRRMAESAAPAACVGCGGPAPRVLSASHVNRRGPGAARSPEPQLVQKKDDRPPPAPKIQHSHGRPWMMGH